MTLERLRKKANKLGYNLIKKKEIPSYVPCICGCNRRTHWFIPEGIKLVCKKCGKDVQAKNEFEARIKWNEMIKKEKGGK